MDIDFEEDQTFSDNEDCEFQNDNNEPWQLHLSNPTERVLALHQTGLFTDITLTFPDTDITYDVHSLILVISSPVFEGILYGPKRTESNNIELHDDPMAMESVIAYCYGYDLELTDMDEALKVYMLADKYLLDGLKTDCCEHIAKQIDKDNNNDVIEFAERFNFTDLKSSCLPHLRQIFCDAQDKDVHPAFHIVSDDHLEFYEPDNTVASTMLIDLNDAWIEGLLSKAEIFTQPYTHVELLDFHKSWKYPESPLPCDRLSTILSSNACLGLAKFYGCIDAENIAHIPENNSRRRYFGDYFGIWGKREDDPSKLYKLSLELCLSATDLPHAKRVIEAINQQNRFENNLIAIHIRCEKVWPKNWSPIPTDRTHRPSLLLISDTDDDKASWVVEAAKAFLPQSEGSYTKVFIGSNYDNAHNDEETHYELKPVNILKLPRSKFTPNGFSSMLQGLYNSGVICDKIIFQSPYFSNEHDHEDRIYRFTSFNTPGHNPKLTCLPIGYNIFRNVFMDFKRIRTF